MTYSKIIGYAHPKHADGVIEKCKTVIQAKCKFSNPEGVFSLTDQSPWAESLYRKWAESYN